MTIYTRTIKRFAGAASVLALLCAGWMLAQTDIQTLQLWMASRPAAMKAAEQSIQQQKAAAMKQGNYTCCLRNPCDFCAVNFAQCPCGKNAAVDKAVCNECKGAWYAGDGAIPGKTPDQIKTLPRPLR
jgi:hypothetical protein